MKEGWIRVTKALPCVICQHGSWCLISTDGKVAICQRVESNKPTKRSGGWVHRLDEPVKVKLEHRPKQKPIVVTDFMAAACKYQDQLLNVCQVADELGVSVRSIERLGTGWNGHVTFPMRDDRERIIGIRIRDKGKQWSVPGSHNGLFWPEGLDYDTLFFCEGPTDCAALLTLGFNAIGRPSCSGGVPYCHHVVMRHKVNTVIIMADNDDPKDRPDGSVWYPGQDGAEKLADALKHIVTCKIIRPPRYKDIREWLNNGATFEQVLSLIYNTEIWR